MRKYYEQLKYYNCSKLDLFRKAALGELEDDDLEHLYARLRYEDSFGINLPLMDAVKELTILLKRPK